MPNAQTHLAAALDLLGRPAVRPIIPWLTEERSRSAFFLGSISPDVRAISGQTREETHFYTIPPVDPVPAHEAMMNAWPQLRDAPALGRPRAAFVAGYMSHLIMDQTWLETIVMPGLFIDGWKWGIEHPNWRVYCILMTYLEYRAEDSLRASQAMNDILRQLAAIVPDGWLPFVADQHLAAWRDHIVQMIATDGARRTSHIFARSLGLSENEIEAIVRSEDRMAAEAYVIVPPDRLALFDAQTGQRMEAMLLRYLGEIDSPGS